MHHHKSFEAQGIDLEPQNKLGPKAVSEKMARFAEHQAGAPKGARSLRGKGPLELVLSLPAGDRSRASKLEWHIKQWPRQRKEALVLGKLSLPDGL